MLSQYQIFIFLVSNLEMITIIWYINPIGFNNQSGLLRHFGVHYYVIIGSCYTKLSKSLYDRYDYANEVRLISFTNKCLCTGMVYLMAFRARLQRGEVTLVGYKLLHYLNILIPEVSKKYSLRLSVVVFR